jgi:RNA polymerase sigma-70 factor (sigma-E family)
MRTPGSRTPPSSFEAFVLDHGPELVAFARRLTLDHHRAEDIVQDVLARVGMAWSRVARSDDVRAYVFKAVLNDFLSWRRRRSSRERATADPAAGRETAAPGVEDTVLLRDELHTALAALSPVQRAVVVLRYHQDLPDAEIARLIRCREVTVRSHAHRALTVLRGAHVPITEGSRP